MEEISPRPQKKFFLCSWCGNSEGINTSLALHLVGLAMK